MTENLDEILNHSNGCKDSKSLVFPKKNLLDSNGYDGTKDSLACETKESNELKVQELDESVFFEDISRSSKHEIRASPLKNDLNEGLSNLTSCKRNGNPFACDTDTHLYTDKGVVEASNYNIMKDICMDESTFKISVDHHITKEDEDTKSLVPNGLKPFSEDNMSKDADKDSYLEDVMKIFGSKCTTTPKATNISEKEPDIQNSKESNSDADQSAQQPDQMPSPSFNSQMAVSAADETNNNGPASNFFNNSKSEAGAITCDLNLTELALSSSVAKTVKNLPEHSLRLDAISSQKDGSSDSFSVANQVHFSNSVDSNNSNVHGQSLDPQNVANFADGEASFSASGLITYSGPISHSGNVSLRSDSSTTSARSFAFPVLQSEWNSSPVRMAKAERRKHRGWRKSLICCKF